MLERERGRRVIGVLTKISDPTGDTDVRREDWDITVDNIQYATKNGYFILQQISRSENFLKKDELDQIKIDFTML